MTHRVQWRSAARFWVAIHVAAIALAAAGCGRSGPAAYWVSGTVTLDKQPLTEGDILLYPDEKNARATMGKVAGGAFRCRVAPGKYRVELQASRMSPTRKSPIGAPIFESLIPERYNAQSTLALTVTPEGPNAFDFALESR